MIRRLGLVIVWCGLAACTTVVPSTGGAGGLLGYVIGTPPRQLAKQRITELIAAAGLPYPTPAP
jgi:hypothetical protein